MTTKHTPGPFEGLVAKADELSGALHAWRKHACAGWDCAECGMARLQTLANEVLDGVGVASALADALEALVRPQLVVFEAVGHPGSAMANAVAALRAAGRLP